MTEDQKRKISEKVRGENHPLYGTKMSEETKQKISKANKGRKWSEETKARVAKESPNAKSFLGKTHTKEAREKISNRVKEWHKVNDNPFLGKTHSKETREKISKANKGKIISEEAKRKISEKMKGENHPFYGKTHSQESRNKMSKSRTGFQNYRKRKRIKAEWMWILTISRVNYESHDYIIKRQKEMFNADTPDMTDAEQLEMF